MLRSCLYGIVFVALGCAGCASGTQFKASEADVEQHDARSAMIYVYRPYRYVSAAVAPDIYLDGKKLVTLRTRGYTRVTVEEGAHEVQLKGTVLYPTPTETLAVDAKGGNNYFFRYLPAFKDLVWLHFATEKNHLTQVDETRALEEIKECRFIQAKP